MRVLITGAAGLVGSALARVYPDAIAMGHRDLDITGDVSVIDRVVDRIEPDVIFNCAVIGVDDCEADPALARRVNVDGPRNLAFAAERLGAAIVHFSSNYVFDGERRDVPYAIDDEAKPVNVYGATKLAGENAVLDAATRAFIVRTSWVFGERKANFLSTVAARLKRGERVQAITDTFASATYVDDLVPRVVEIVERGRRGIHHVVNEGVLSNEMFAREAARFVGADESLIEPVIEARPAPRPRWTPMQCLPPLRPWQDALRAFLG